MDLPAKDARLLYVSVDMIYAWIRNGDETG